MWPFIFHTLTILKTGFCVLFAYILHVGMVKTSDASPQPSKEQEKDVSDTKDKKSKKEKKEKKGNCIFF